MKIFSQKQKGFTLVELLIVIVIIGILATIGLSTFDNYLVRARDTERLSNIRNMATILKVAYGAEVIDDYNFGTMADFDSDSNLTTDTDSFRDLMIAEADFEPPEAQGGLGYFYVYGGTGNREFAVMVCKEEDAPANVDEAEDVLFIQGTPAAVNAIDSADATTICDADPPGPGASPAEFSEITGATGIAI